MAGRQQAPRQAEGKAQRVGRRRATETYRVLDEAAARQLGIGATSELCFQPTRLGLGSCCWPCALADARLTCPSRQRAVGIGHAQSKVLERRGAFAIADGNTDSEFFRLRETGMPSVYSEHGRVSQLPRFVKSRSRAEALSLRLRPSGRLSNCADTPRRSSHASRAQSHNRLLFKCPGSSAVRRFRPHTLPIQEVHCVKTFSSICSTVLAPWAVRRLRGRMWKSS